MWGKRLLLALTGLLCLSLSAGNEIEAPLENEDAAPKRDGKVLSLFSIVTFKNAGCQSTDGTVATSGINRNGTCYTSTECSDKGGSAKGNCAAGFGVCCLFVYTSTSSTISENCSYIQNPSFPSVYSTTTALTYTVAKCATDVCLFRLDFETFQIDGPTATAEASGGLCVDSFKASTTGTGLSTPLICGSNAGQHIYLDVGTGSSATATLAFTFATTSSTTRTWEVKVTQIPCSSNYRPPDGCLQYHTGLTGVFSTFNYAETTTPSHLASQDYSICIRTEAGNCCIQYSPCSDTNAYTLSTTGTLTQASQDSICTADFIGIDGVTDVCQQTGTMAILHTKLCGNNFHVNAAETSTGLQYVCDCTGPFAVNIYTDASIETAATISGGNRGLCLTYRQVPCI